MLPLLGAAVAAPVALDLVQDLGVGVGAVSKRAALPPVTGDLKEACFAGGCFWCLEAPFDRLEGVVATTSGYTGGDEADPTYLQVSGGGTGHAEAVRVLYDPKVVSYEQLLKVYWHQVDPTTVDRQFVDAGHQYRTAIFVYDDAQRRAAEASRAALERTGVYGGPLVTAIEPAKEFWAAEEYHQDYYAKKKLRYEFYRGLSGRDEYLQATWGLLTAPSLRARQADAALDALIAAAGA